MRQTKATTMTRRGLGLVGAERGEEFARRPRLDNDATGVALARCRGLGSRCTAPPSGVIDGRWGGGGIHMFEHAATMCTIPLCGPPLFEIPPACTLPRDP